MAVLVRLAGGPRQRVARGGEARADRREEDRGGHPRSGGDAGRLGGALRARAPRPVWSPRVGTRGGGGGFEEFGRLGRVKTGSTARMRHFQQESVDQSSK